jgi:hypothetical protein
VSPEACSTLAEAASPLAAKGKGEGGDLGSTSAAASEDGFARAAKVAFVSLTKGRTDAPKAQLAGLSGKARPIFAAWLLAGSQGNCGFAALRPLALVLWPTQDVARQLLKDPLGLSPSTMRRILQLAAEGDWRDLGVPALEALGCHFPPGSPSRASLLAEGAGAAVAKLAIRSIAKSPSSLSASTCSQFLEAEGAEAGRGSIQGKEQWRAVVRQALDSISSLTDTAILAARAASLAIEAAEREGGGDEAVGELCWTVKEVRDNMGGYGEGMGRV